MLNVQSLNKYNDVLPSLEKKDVPVVKKIIRYACYPKGILSEYWYHLKLLKDIFIFKMGCMNTVCDVKKKIDLFFNYFNGGEDVYHSFVIITSIIIRGGCIFHISCRANKVVFTKVV